MSKDSNNGHRFHIPIMGTGFTIDSPLKVAKYGISSVISLVDDVLIEQMRSFYCKKEGEPYEEITDKDKDARANRITAYLNLVDKLVKRQVKELQASPFDDDSEITKYYRMLPEDSELKALYNQMLDTTDEAERSKLQASLREKALPGSIDVNIMTKLDVVHYSNGDVLPKEFNDAMAALRGYAESSLQSAIVFSAGINNQLYTYIAQFKDFFADKKSHLKKKIILKVSDYRSALTQGKFLAKKGLWVSEYRVESGLNCGGHTFATNGRLLGPVMDEFKKKRHELLEKVHQIYVKARKTLNLDELPEIHKTLFTVQGGVAVSDEADLMINHYEADSTGWGTPFLLVPEAVNIDNRGLELLESATRDDAFLSNSSPVGVPFWNLRKSMSEDARRGRIEAGKPGSGCPKGFLRFTTEFTERPQCLASRGYQREKLEELDKSDYSPEQMELLRDDVLAKACICDDLAGVALLKNDIDKDATPAICCGPNIGYFDKQYSLEEMISHIYGRMSLIASSDRPHMFIEELKIYIEHLHNELTKYKLEISTTTSKYLLEFKDNLLEGIEYYTEFAKEVVEEKRERFIDDLEHLRKQVESITLTPVPVLD